VLGSPLNAFVLNCIGESVNIGLREPHTSVKSKCAPEFSARQFTRFCVPQLRFRGRHAEVAPKKPNPISSFIDPNG
jgi:hypothetical protein